MSNLLTTAYLMERYGPLLTEEQLGEVLHLAAGTVRNQRVRGELPVRGVKTGAHWVFHAADVAAHVDGLRAPFREPTIPQPQTEKRGWRAA